MILPVVVLIAIILLIFGLLIYFLSPKSSTKSLGEDVFSINTLTQFSDNILSTPYWTMSFFIHPIAKNQVIEQYIPIVAISDSLRLEMSGIPNKSSPESSIAQLVVGNVTSPIQSIPYQKWTYVTIVRDSMRITVYYNGKAVFSNIYNSITPSSVIAMGNSSAYVAGQFANLRVTEGALSVANIKQTYSELSDTTGKPYSTYAYKFPRVSDIFSMKMSNVMPAITVEASAAPTGVRWNQVYQ